MTEGELRDAVKSAIELIERLTALPSFWSGHLELTDELRPNGRPVFIGRKNWSCAMTFHIEYLNDPMIYGSIVHEGFHSVSQGVTSLAFAGSHGFEEGVVEYLTRRYLPQFGQQLGWPLVANQRQAFHSYLIALEQCRSKTGIRSDEFYLRLLKVPLVEGRATMIQWIMDANPNISRSHVLASLAGRFRNLK